MEQRYQRLTSINPKKNNVYNNPPTEQGKSATQVMKEGKKPVAQTKAVGKKPTEELILDQKSNNKPTYVVPNENKESFSHERLQEAILWSEILGKPVSKRRKRRM